MRATLRWAPAVILGIGAVLATAGVQAQRSLQLRQSLGDAVPSAIAGLAGRDLQLGRGEAEAAGVTSYLMREFGRTDSAAAAFSLYVGYYDRQTQGKTIHSPKNCLPGAGWEPLASRTDTITVAGAPAVVNRYLLQHGRDQALVLYWYQGRGRIAANEYLVKWNLLRDAALRRRSDEALVRIVVPVRASEAEAVRLARSAAATIAPALTRALPS
jgi:EpsI family protein